MKKSFLHAIKKFLRISVILMVLVGMNQELYAQGSIPGLCSVSCNDQVNVSLDNSGYALIDPFMVWEESANIVCFPLLESVTVEIEGVSNAAGTETLYGHTITTGSALLGCAYVGQNLEYKLVKKYLDGTVNTCWGHVLIEDKIDPSISCTNLEVECNYPTDPYQLDNYYAAAVPTVSDNCGIPTLTYTDVVVDNGCSSVYLKEITRTWTATDNSGNTSTCTQVLSIKKADDSKITFPSDKVLECGNANIDPSNTGYPLYDGGSIIYDGPCKLTVSYDDIVIDLCGNTRKIKRNWMVMNLCSNEMTMGTQILDVVDTQGPIVTCPENITIGTTSNSCTGNVNLPNPTVSDACSEPVTIEIFASSGSLNGNLLTGLELGVHTITYIGTDACGNETPCVMKVTVEDNIAPIAICDEHTVVSIGSDGYASVPALVFDDGSYDNCGIVEYQVRRMTDACHFPPQLGYDDYAVFCCADIGTTVMVQLRIKDEAGNINTCMVEVEVEDKLKPTIICPPNKTINCDDDPFDLGLTGEAVGSDNCGDPVITHNDISNTIDQCGEGYIIRQWIATDAQGLTASCLQTITLINTDKFDYYDIVWPYDYEANTCGLGLSPDDLPTPYDRPVVTEDACDLLSVTYDDEVLPISGDACFKILRTWIVVDWCQYDPNVSSTNGRWEHVQIIKILNSTAPVVTAGGDTNIDNFDADCGSAYVELFANATDDCTPAADLEYSYSISTGAVGSGNNASQAFANGSYSITWSVTDGCGNTTTETHDFVVKDAKKPTPVCINGLSTDLMPNAGEVTIWASDFEAGSSFDNCTPYADLKFSFSSDVTETSKVFTCDQIGTQVVELWVTDNAGNQDFCQTYIIIQDNNGACGVPTTYSAIEGSVENEMGEEIEDVTIKVNGSNAVPTITGANGGFAFPTIANSNSYDVSAEKNMNPLNGVTTFDLVLMSKHILGITNLDSPYKMIAADINRSNSITTFDIVQARRVILNIDTEFTNNTSWRFVDANFVFDNPANPFASDFPEVVNIDNLTADEAANFVGVKVGDLNQSATPNSLLGTDTRTTVGTLEFHADDASVKAGDDVVIEFKAQDFNTINGFQFTFNFDNTVLEFVDVKAGIESISAANFGFTSTNEGLITASWNKAKAISLDDETVIFSFIFNATATAQLSETVSISSRVTTAEAYNNAAEIMDVQLAFNGTVTTSNKFEVMQNQPNPFKDATVIPVNMDEAGMVTLKVMDVTGKVVTVVEGDFNKGYNEFKLTRNNLPSAGVMYYSVETGKHTVTKKMIIINK